MESMEQEAPHRPRRSFSRGFKADIMERYRAGDRSIGQVARDPYHTSRLATVLVAVITSNTALATMPGNVFMPAR